MNVKMSQYVECGNATHIDQLAHWSHSCFVIARLLRAYR